MYYLTFVALIMIATSFSSDEEADRHPSSDETCQSGYVLDRGKCFATNPFNSLDVGSDSTPTFVDIDGDGDLDAFIGESSGTINYYKNTGSASAPRFVAQTGTDNPLNVVDVGDDSSPTFVDIDGDGDLDIFIGEDNGNINYYKNTGSASEPRFVKRTGIGNPLNGVDVGSNSRPTFADIDGDGDLDAFIGESSGTINYYENTGSASAPIFVKRTGTDNPLYIDVGSYSAPIFVDIDGDGDLDAFIGELNRNINYYENIGSSALPIFNLIN